MDIFFSAEGTAVKPNESVVIVQSLFQYFLQVLESSPEVRIEIRFPDCLRDFLNSRCMFLVLYTDWYVGEDRTKMKKLYFEYIYNYFLL